MCFKLVTRQDKLQKGEIIKTMLKLHAFIKHRIPVLTYQCFHPPTLLGVVERDKETGHYLE